MNVNSVMTNYYEQKIRLPAQAKQTQLKAKQTQFQAMIDRFITSR